MKLKPAHHRHLDIDNQAGGLEEMRRRKKIRRRRKPFNRIP
jgi:hypothetical protein